MFGEYQSIKVEQKFDYNSPLPILESFKYYRDVKASTETLNAAKNFKSPPRC